MLRYHPRRTSAFRTAETTQSPVQGVNGWHDLDGYPFSSSGGLSANDAVVDVKISGVGTYSFYSDNHDLKRTTDSATLASVLSGADGMLEKSYDHKGGNDIIMTGTDASKPLLKQRSWGAGARWYLEFDGGDDRIANADTASIIKISDRSDFVVATLRSTSGNGGILGRPQSGTPYLDIYKQGGQWGAAAGSNYGTTGTTDTNEHVFLNHQSDTSADDGLFIDTTASRVLAVTTSTVDTKNFGIGDIEPVSGFECDVDVGPFGFYDALTMVQNASMISWLATRYTTA